MSTSGTDKRPSPGEALDIAYEINKILDCGLDKNTLSICIALLEAGVHPEALAAVVKKLRRLEEGRSYRRESSQNERQKERNT